MHAVHPETSLEVGRLFDPNVLLGYIVDGRYRLVSVCGTGSYGWVYAADELAFGEVIGQVAVKLLRPPDDEARHAVINEVTAMRQLSHPHILACHGAGEVAEGPASGCVFIVTELGSATLESRMKMPPAMTPNEARELVQHVASALAYLAERRAVHRDVKPANILRVGNVWKLADFGLVRGMEGTRAQTGTVKGTVHYMSPEALNREVGPFVDVWALGVVIQECLTGRLPYPSGSEPEVIAAILSQEPSISQDLPEPFGKIVRGCLTKNRHQRWTAHQVMAAIGALPHQGSPQLSTKNGEIQSPKTASRTSRPSFSQTATTPTATTPVTAEGVAVQSLLDAARRALTTGNPEEALAACNRALSIDRDAALAYVWRARVHCWSSNAKDGLKDANQALSLEPESPDALIVQAIALALQGRQQDAVKSIQKVMEQSGEIAWAYQVRGWLAASRNSSDEAIADYTVASLKAPDRPQPLVLRAAEYLRRGDYEQAIDDCQAALQRQPSYVDALALRGDAHVVAGRWLNAVSDYSEVLQALPHHTLALSARGWLYLWMNKTAQAINDGSRWITQEPKNAEAYLLRAEAHWRMADFDHAIADANAALRFQPGHHRAQVILSRCVNHSRPVGCFWAVPRLVASAPWLVGLYRSGLANRYRAFGQDAVRRALCSF